MNSEEADYDDEGTDEPLSAGSIAVQAAAALSKQTDQSQDMPMQLKMMNEQLHRLNLLAEKQLRAMTTGSLVHSEGEHEYTVTLTPSWSGTMAEFASMEGRRIWVPTYSKCLKPAELSDAEYERLFPNNQAELISIDVEVTEMQCPFAVGFSLSNMPKIPPTETPGTQKKYHLSVNAWEKPKGKKTLHIGRSALKRTEFSKVYPGWTPDRIRTEGYMLDAANPNRMFLGSDQPSLEWALKTLKCMMETEEDEHKRAAIGKEYQSVLDQAAVSDYVSMSTPFCKDCMEQCANDVDSMQVIVDLTELPKWQMDRPGAEFDSPLDLRPQEVHRVSALLKAQLPAMGSDGGYTGDATTVNGARLLASSAIPLGGKKIPGTAMLTASAVAAASSTDSSQLATNQTQLLYNHMLNTPLSASLRVSYTFRSPLGSVAKKRAAK